MRLHIVVIPFVALLLAAAPTLAAPIGHNSSGNGRVALEDSALSEELMLEAIADLLSDAGWTISVEELQDANLNRPRLLVLLNFLSDDDSLAELGRGNGFLRQSDDNVFPPGLLCFSLLRQPDGSCGITPSSAGEFTDAAAPLLVTPAAIPEPASLLLVGSALGGLLLNRRRRKLS